MNLSFGAAVLALLHCPLAAAQSAGNAPALPTGYQLPAGVQIDFVIDGRAGFGPTHPVKYALETLMPAHPAFPFPEGSGVAVILPAGQFEDFGINVASGGGSGAQNQVNNPWIEDQSKPILDQDPSTWWGDVFLHLMGPHANYNGFATEPTLVIEPRNFIHLGSDTIRLAPDGDWPSRLALHSMRVNSAGRKCVGHSDRDSIDPATPFTPPSLRSPLGSQLHFYNCKFGTSPKAPVPVNGATTGNDTKWGVHTFWTAPYFRNCVFDFVDALEHAVYAHQQTPYTSGMRNCSVRGLGAQIWQETCRDAVHPTAAAWNLDTNGTYEGEWPGTGKTVIRKVHCDNECCLGTGRSSAALAFYATGRTIEVLQNTIRMDRPGVLRSPTPTNPSTSTRSAIKAGPNTFITSSGITYHRERGKFPFYSDDPVTNPDPFLFKDITIRDNTFVFGSSGSVEMGQLASVEGRLTVERNGIYYGAGNDPGTAGQNGAQWRVSEENLTPPISNPTYALATSDIGLVIWQNNNTSTTLTAALAAFPNMTAAQASSNPVVLEGCAATTQAGVFAGRADATILRAFQEYPNGNDPN